MQCAWLTQLAAIESLQHKWSQHTVSAFTIRLLSKKILKGPLELKAENLGAQHMKRKVLLWKIQAPSAILRVPQATRFLLGNSLAVSFQYFDTDKKHWE